MMHRVELTLTVFVEDAIDKEHGIRAARAYAEESARDSVGMADFSHICEVWPYVLCSGVIIRAAAYTVDEEG